MSEWREIKSAPRDGTVILCYFPDEPERRRMSTGFFLPNVPSGVFGALFGHDITAPTHWMPIPAPPEPAEGKR